VKVSYKAEGNRAAIFLRYRSEIYLNLLSITHSRHYESESRSVLVRYKSRAS